MIRHCVAFTWRDGVTAGDIAAIAERLGRLPELIPEIGAYHFGPDLGLGDGNHDYAVVGDFATIDDYTIYASHGDHVAVINELIKPAIAERVAVQFEF